MDVLNFSSYAKAIERGMINPDHTEITQLLLGFIVDRIDVTNKLGEQYSIDNHLAHQWWNQIEDIPKNIKKAAGRFDIQATADDYFEENVLYSLSPPKDADTFTSLKELINQQDMAMDTRSKLLRHYSENELNEFLAQTFLLAVQKSNKVKKPPHAQTSSLFADDVKKLQTLLTNLPKPIKLIPPEDLAEQEMKYVQELFAAYADAEGLDDFAKNDFDSYKKYKNDFSRQRKSYYAAESIRQSVRDILTPMENIEFDVLKDETLEGVTPVYEKCYPNGFERLCNVMEHATVIKVNKSLLAQIPGWVGPAETKGICHMLVNDGEIRWVDEDE